MNNLNTHTDIAPASGEADQDGMMLVFRINGQNFALPVHMVHEIIDPIAATHLPHAPEHAPALINVRGAIVPLIDIRKRLSLSDDRQGAGRLIVLELPVTGTPTRLAIETDAVESVLDLPIDETEPIPDLGARWPHEFVRGISRSDCGLVVLLAADTLFRP